METEAFTAFKGEKTAAQGSLVSRFLDVFHQSPGKMQHERAIYQIESRLRVGEGRFLLNLHSCSPAAFSNGITDELAVSLQTDLNTVLRTQSQHRDCLPADVGVGIEHRLFELWERQRCSHPKPPKDELLHNCPDLLNGRQIW